MEKINKNSSTKYISKKEENTIDEEFSLFQSDVAHALLDYIEDKDDTEVVTRLEETQRFFVKLSKEISSTLPQKNLASNVKSEDFDCAEDLLKGYYPYSESSLLH